MYIHVHSRPEIQLFFFKETFQLLKNLKIFKTRNIFLIFKYSPKKKERKKKRKIKRKIKGKKKRKIKG